MQNDIKSGFCQCIRHLVRCIKAWITRYSQFLSANDNFLVDNRNVCRLHLLFHISKKTGKIIRAILCLTAFFHRSVKQNIPNHGKCHGRT